LHRAADADTLLGLVVLELGRHALPDKVKVALLDFATPLLPRCLGLQGAASTSGGSATANSSILKPLLLKLAPLALLDAQTTTPFSPAPGGGGGGHGSRSVCSPALGAAAQRDRAELAAAARSSIAALARRSGGAAVVGALKGGLPLEQVTALKAALSGHGSSGSGGSGAGSSTLTREASGSSGGELPWDTPAAKPPRPPATAPARCQGPSPPKGVASPDGRRHASPAPHRSSPQGTSPLPVSPMAAGKGRRSPPPPHHTMRQASPLAAASARSSRGASGRSPGPRASPARNAAAAGGGGGGSPTGLAEPECAAAPATEAAHMAAAALALQQLSSNQPAAVRSAGARAIAALCAPRLRLAPQHVGPALLLLLEGLHAAAAAPPTAAAAHGSSSSSAADPAAAPSVALGELERLHACLAALHALATSAYAPRLDGDGYTHLVATRLLHLGDGGGGSGPLPYEVAQKATEVSECARLELQLCLERTGFLCLEIRERAPLCLLYSSRVCAERALLTPANPLTGPCVHRC
jgi:hypothetical protein